MTTRIVAIGMLVALLGVVAAFMAIALIGPRGGPLSADTGSALIAREQDMGSWTLQAQLALASTGAYELDLRFVDEAGATASLPGSPHIGRGSCRARDGQDVGVMVGARHYKN